MRGTNVSLYVTHVSVYVWTASENLLRVGNQVFFCEASVLLTNSHKKKNGDFFSWV